MLFGRAHPRLLLAFNDGTDPALDVVIIKAIHIDLAAVSQVLVRAKRGKHRKVRLLHLHKSEQVELDLIRQARIGEGNLAFERFSGFLVCLHETGVLVLRVAEEDDDWAVLRKNQIIVDDVEVEIARDQMRLSPRRQLGDEV